MKRESVGEILCKIEVQVNKLFDQHGFQWGDWLYNQLGWLQIHRKGDREKYIDGGSPAFRYGPPPDKEKLARSILKKLKTFENCQSEMKMAREIIELVEEEYE